jgi:hypothetical protein
METVPWLGTLLLLPVAGAPLLARPTFRRFAPAARVVLAAGAGAALVSFAMTLFSLAGLRWSPLPLVLTAALLAGTFGRLAGGTPEPAPVRGAIGRASLLAAGISAVCVVAALAATLAGAATSGDLFFFWGPKAQQFAVTRGVDVAFLADPSHGYMHPYYPPLVSGLDAFASIASGRFSWTAAALTFPLLLAALAISLPGVLRGAVARPRAAAAAALVMAAVGALGIRAAVAGNGDMPLVFYETLAMALLLRRDAGDAAVQWLAGILIAGAASAKVEGLAFGLAAATLFVALGLGEAGAPRIALRLLLPGALALGAWFTFGISRGLFHEYSEYGRFLEIHLEHLPRVGAAVWQTLSGTGRGLPYLVPLVCLLMEGRPPRAALLPLGTAGALVFFLIFTYLHLANDPSEWIAWSAARVFMPVAVLLALAPCAAGEPARERSTPGPSPR